jgi:hypothetical protein
MPATPTSTDAKHTADDPRQDLIDAVWEALTNAQDYDTTLTDMARAVVDSVPLVKAAPDLLASLKLIAAMGDKTLIAPSMGECCDRAHQIGANKAFEQAADIARAAIARAVSA